MNIHKAIDLIDIKNLVPLAKDYHSKGVIPFELNVNHWVNTWADLLTFGSGKIWWAEGAQNTPCSALGGVLSHNLSSGELEFGEAFFYSSEAANGAGLWLYKRVEKELEELGVKRIYMHSRLNFMPERVGKFYSYMGFQPNEIQWVKEI